MSISDRLGADTTKPITDRRYKYNIKHSARSVESNAAAGSRQRRRPQRTQCALGKGAGLRWRPLPQAEAPTEPAGEKASCRRHDDGRGRSTGRGGCGAAWLTVRLRLGSASPVSARCALPFSAPPRSLLRFARCPLDTRNLPMKLRRSVAAGRARTFCFCVCVLMILSVESLHSNSY